MLRETLATSRKNRHFYTFASPCERKSRETRRELREILAHFYESFDLLFYSGWIDVYLFVYEMGQGETERGVLYDKEC